MAYFVYILFSKSSNIYYVGQTEDVEKRLHLHNSLTYNSFTSKHVPWVLKMKLEVGPERSIAMRIEKYIKKQKSRKYIESLITSKQIQQKLIEKFKNKD